MTLDDKHGVEGRTVSRNSRQGMINSGVLLVGYASNAGCDSLKHVLLSNADIFVLPGQARAA